MKNVNYLPLRGDDEKMCADSKTHFFKKVETLSEKDIAEYNAYLQLRQTLAIERISKNVAFFFYFTIIPIALAILFFMNKS